MELNNDYVESLARAVFHVSGDKRKWYGSGWRAMAVKLVPVIVPYAQSDKASTKLSYTCPLLADAVSTTTTFVVA